MHNIAYLYANHRWMAGKTNLIQYPYPPSRFNSNGKLLEPDITQVKYFGDPSQQLFLTNNFTNSNPVISPNWIVIKENMKPLFSITDSSLVTTIANDLNNMKMDDALSNAFQDALGHSLDGTAPPVAEQPGSQWAIIDSNDTSYQIRFENQILNVYSGENAGTPVGENQGVPYAWGQSSGLIASSYDKALDTQMIDVSLPVPVSKGYSAANASFDTKISGGYFAGNQYYPVQPGNSYAAGVDCVGLINNVWQLGGKLGVPTDRDGPDWLLQGISAVQEFTCG